MSPETDLSTEVAAIVGATHLSSLESDRAEFSGLDPALVVWPKDGAEIAAILRLANRRRIHIAVRGGGTGSPCWRRPSSPVLGLSTRRMINIVELDSTSGTVIVQAGIRWSKLCDALEQHGLWTGLPRDAFGEATIGGLLADPPANAHSPSFGPLSELCVSTTVACADGSLLRSRTAPRRAVGPDVGRMLLGDRANVAILTELVLRTRQRPALIVPALQLFPTLRDALTAARAILQIGVRPTMLRVANQAQAAREIGPQNFSIPAVVGLELAGPQKMIDRALDKIDEIAAQHSGQTLPADLAADWYERTCSEYALDGHSTRLSHREALAAIGRFTDAGRRVWLDQFDAHRVNLWTESDEPTVDAVAMRGSRDDHWLAAIKAALDPHQVLLGAQSIE
ncbi:MAG: FAD-binding protein [Deltaproteobacteria bacterium]|nr:FAD-binding protein [Deltaproteobacteria bacterium]